MPDRSKIGKKDQARQTRETVSANTLIKKLDGLPELLEITQVENGWKLIATWPTIGEEWPESKEYVFVDNVTLAATVSALIGVEVREN